MRGNNQTLVGYFLGAELFLGTRAHAVIARHLDDIAAGRLRVVIDRRFPLEEAGEAHAYIESRQAFGRVLLDPLTLRAGVACTDDPTRRPSMTWTTLVAADPRPGRVRALARIGGGRRRPCCAAPCSDRLPAVFAHVAEEDGADRRAWPSGSSTSPPGRVAHGIYLEDLYVRPEARGTGRRPGAAGRAGRHLPGASGYRTGRLVGAHWNETGPPLLPLARGGAPWTSGSATGWPASPGDLARPARPSGTGAGEPGARSGSRSGGDAQMVKARLATSWAPSARSPDDA